MGTSRPYGFKMTAAIWNAITAYLSDDGGTYTGAVDSPSVVSEAMVVVPSAPTSASYLQANNNGGSLYTGLDNSTGSVFGTGAYVAMVYADGINGLTVQSAHASSFMWFKVGTTTRMAIHASGGVSIGDTSDPGATNLRVAGNVTVASDLKIGTTFTTDSSAFPSIDSGFGSGATITGRVYAFRVTLGSSPGSTGTVSLNTTFSEAPIVMLRVTNNPTMVLVASVNASQIILSYTNGVVNDVIEVMVRGFV